MIEEDMVEEVVAEDVVGEMTVREGGLIEEDGCSTSQGRVGSRN